MIVVPVLTIVTSLRAAFAFTTAEELVPIVCGLVPGSVFAVVLVANCAEFGDRATTRASAAVVGTTVVVIAEFGDSETTSEASVANGVVLAPLITAKLPLAGS